MSGRTPAGVATRSWRSRVADYETLRSNELRDYVRGAGIQVTGYRVLRDLMPNL